MTPSTTAPTLAVDSRCELGECVLWDERRGVLFWTDITSARLWTHRPDSGATRNWQLPERLGCFALCEDDRLLLGLAKGLSLFDPDADGLMLQHVAAVEPERDDTRLNDGRCDRQGNFVFGTKNERDDTPCGSYYQFSFAHGLRRLALPAAAIPNSICFSHDGGTMYFCDSRVPEILCCDYEPASAAVSDVRRFAGVDAAGASPDGSIVDAGGCLWNAQWGAARVVRYRPDGSIDRIVPVAAKNPSCCAFGGADFDQLYISTAREDMGADELARMPQAGGIYRAASSDVCGLPESRLAGAS
jgi:sugar lactone lactonase YvrE